MVTTASPWAIIRADASGMPSCGVDSTTCRPCALTKSGTGRATGGSTRPMVEVHTSRPSRSREATLMYCEASTMPRRRPTSSSEQFVSGRAVIRTSAPVASALMRSVRVM